jgi:hypothetical protein
LVPTDLKEDLIAASLALGGSVRLLEETRGTAFVRRFLEKYGERILPYPINTYGAVAIQYAEDDYLRLLDEVFGRVSRGANSELLMIADFSIPIVMASTSGEALSELVKEMYGFPYILTDGNLSFVLCENIHNMFCAIGWADEIVEGLAAD